MGSFVARHAERQLFGRASTSTEPELIAVYGRRRVGKTFLVREALARELCFEQVGIHHADLGTQLRAFAAALGKAAGGPVPRAPSDWHEAFQMLEAFLTRLLARRRGKLAVFFDEVPWLASRKSAFLPALEYFWNAWGSRQPRLLVVLCGSAASWMLQNVVRERGGLHNRVTRRVRVEPFQLADAEELLASRGIELGHFQTIELTLALGGVPHYLAQVERGESAAQAIDRLCFSRDGLLRTEFPQLYASLFEQAERHEAVVRALAARRRGLTRSELATAAGLASGGALTKVLEELEESGFILQTPMSGKLKRDAIYWLGDEYSLFYLTWIARRAPQGRGYWLHKQASPAWRAWAGLAFESLCLKHVKQLKHALGISGVETTESAWAYRPATKSGVGAQIDLVIDRADRCINLCEMKFSDQPFTIDKAYARELAHKRDTYRRVTGTRKATFLTLVSTFGLVDNEHSRGLVTNAVGMDALFARLA